MMQQATSYETLRRAYQEAINETLAREVFLRQTFLMLEKKLNKLERLDMVRNEDIRRVSDMDTEVASDDDIE